MRTNHILGILALLALAVPAAPAQAGGVVTVCDEAHLLTALAGGGTVTFACSGTITLTSTITIAADTTIDGSGQSVTISGNNAVRVFTMNSGTTLNLNRLTIADGSADWGGGILVVRGSTLNVNNTAFTGNNATPGGGGAIVNYGTLTVRNSTFSGNSSSFGGGGIDSYDSTLFVSNSTFSANSTDLGGGGIYNHGLNGNATVSNSTFNDNRAVNGPGGGIFNLYGTLTVINSTLSNNGAVNTPGGGIYNNLTSGTVTLRNTIVANSFAGDNCYGAIIDGGGNLSYPDTTCPGVNADPALGPLQNNGGPTWTMALGPGGAAIDAANDATCAAAPVNGLDQRGITRPQGPHCDIGAVEQVPPMPPRIWLPLVHWW